MAHASGYGDGCQSAWTVYETFAAQQQPNCGRMPKAHREKFADLLSLPLITLNAAREATRNCIKEYLRYDDGRTTEFARAMERQVTSSFDSLRSLRSLIEQTPMGLLIDMVHRQDEHLIRATTYPTSLPKGKFILVAFSVIEDQTITLTQTELDRLIKGIARREGKSEPDARREARQRADAGMNAKREKKLDDEIWDGIDILAHVFVLMRREGLKPAVLNPALQQWLIDYFAENPSIERTFGGAAGNETFMLRVLGLPMLLHVPYHHDEQAAIAPECAKRLVFGTAGPIKPFPSIRKGNSNDARRFSFVFQLTPELNKQGDIIGPTFLVNSEEVRPVRPDRVILRVPNPRTNTPVTWEKLRVSWKGTGLRAWKKRCSGILWNAKKRYWFVEVNRSALKGFLDNDRLYLPLFQHESKVDPSTKTLVIELATAEEMKLIARDVQVALLGGIQALGRSYYTRELTELLRHALVAQLRALSSQGVSMNLELSGVDSGAVLEVLGDLLQKAGLRDISLNREELVQITSQFGSPYFTSFRTSIAEKPIGIYFRAKELLRRLGMDSIYVHDIELDILVRHNGKKEDSAKGKMALERHRQAMMLSKAAVPAALIQRAKAPQKWDLVLSTESLTALLAFATDYSALVESTMPTLNRDSILSALLRDGYYHPGEKDISVAVAPTIIVDLPNSVSLSGAGDACFAVHGAAS